MKTHLNLIIAVLILYAGVSETIYSFIEYKGFRVGAHHGIILFAILQILKTIANLYVVMMKIDELTNTDDEQADVDEDEALSGNQKRDFLLPLLSVT